MYYIRVKKPLWLFFLLLAVACGGESSLTPQTSPAQTPTPTIAATLTLSGRGPSEASPERSPYSDVVEGSSPTTIASTSPPSPTPTLLPTLDPAYKRQTQFVPLYSPTFVKAGDASYLRDDDLVLGLELNGEARAYPVMMMWYHHIANDMVQGSPVLITY